ncbi:MAG: hypothetical protein LWW79_12435 [Holophagaceae bacterium]|jgi:hypothetical protein|nr:hypothetical protein [Holophagaceae bacterium]
MPARIPAIYGLLLPMTLALGWYGTRTARRIHLTRESRVDQMTLLVVGWFPLLCWLLALLASGLEGNP